jgi:hypothetical protein
MAGVTRRRARRGRGASRGGPPTGNVHHEEAKRTDADGDEHTERDKPSRARATLVLSGGRRWRGLRRRRTLGEVLVMRTLGEVLVLTVYAIDLTRGPSPERHERACSSSGSLTRAAGSEDGEISRSRPTTCGWEAPCDRLGNRPPASQGTRLCLGRVIVIGVSLLSNPTGAWQRDSEMCVSHEPPRLLGRLPTAPDAHARAGPPCGTSQPTSHGRGRTRGSLCRVRSDLPARAADRSRARAMTCRCSPGHGATARGARRSRTCRRSPLRPPRGLGAAARSQAPPPSGCDRSAPGAGRGSVRAVAGRARWRCGRDWRTRRRAWRG